MYIHTKSKKESHRGKKLLCSLAVWQWMMAAVWTNCGCFLFRHFTSLSIFNFVIHNNLILYLRAILGTHGVNWHICQSNCIVYTQMRIFSSMAIIKWKTAEKRSMSLFKFISTVKVKGSHTLKENVHQSSLQFNDFYSSIRLNKWNTYYFVTRNIHEVWFKSAGLKIHIQKIFLGHFHFN